MKIAYCLPVLRSPDTTDTSFLHQMLIAEALKARGHQLTFFMQKDLVDMVSTRDFQTHLVLPRSWSRSIWFDLAGRAAWRLQQMLGVPYLNVFSNYRYLDACLHSLPGYDLVHERSGLYKNGVALACKRLGLPYILFFDGDDILEHDYAGTPLTGLLRWRAAQVFRYNFAAADGVICVSDTARARLISVWQVPEEKIAVFPNAVNLNQYCPHPELKAETRSSLGINQDLMLVFVGSFYPWQDVTLLLQAFVQVLKVYPQAHLVLAGDGEQYRSMVQYVHELGLDPAVKFTGFVPQARVAQLVSAADMAVAPYTNMPPELFCGSSMKVFEYMACQTAVVATNLGQIAEVIQDGVNGLLVRPGDCQSLADALLRLAGDAALRDRLGARARQDAIQKHSWDSYVTRLEQLYKTTIQRKTLVKHPRI